ncbi:MAG: NADH-quinone oxidoreductase subunit NuoE [Blastocatellia bacterium]|nr:NADH-quinone oxidoreductase subunit NuoE [Blastocatellia bacterium]
MFSEALDKKANEIIARYPVKRSALLPLLHLVQNEENQITKEGMRYVAKKVGVEMNDVFEVLTFYTMYFTEPIGTHHIQLCRTISCYLRGAEEIREHLEKRLGIKPGQRTADGRFRLSEVECLGSCCTAPMFQINFDYHENLTPEKVDQILDSLP